MLIPRFIFPLLIGLALLQSVTSDLSGQHPSKSEPVSGGSIGVPMTYELPTDPAGKTYLVTLAIVDPANPDWIISTFVAGEPRTVTAENRGKFSEIWDGLDENFMPVPPGNYAVKGIYSEARQWIVDGEWHAITPQFVGGASSWMPPREDWSKPVPFGGDPVNSPLRDVAVGANGVAVFYYQYLENGKNSPMFDLNKPIGYDQFLRAFTSGGAGGGPCAATDGETVWAFASDGGPKFLYRTDQKDFGSSPGANRRNGQIPEGWVVAMAAQRMKDSGKAFVYAAQRGRIESAKATKGSASHIFWESKTDMVSQVTIHDGEGGAILATLEIDRPQGLVLYGGNLYALHREGEGYAVSKVLLKNGLPDGDWKRVFTVPTNITPYDLELDSKGRLYLSDSAANKVYQMDDSAKILRTYGRSDVQKPGSYDPETLMSPAKLATWRDAAGLDRLLIVENAGPNRVSEWSAEDGSLMREFMTHQTKCNSGYGIDPANTTHIYLPTHEDWLTRFRVNYDTGEWKVDAVWPDVPAGQRKGLEKPAAIRLKDQLYLASERTLLVYRLNKEGNRWLRSAGVIVRNKDQFFWNDANGNGEIDELELRPMTLPGHVMTYHGQRWLSDLSYISPVQGGKDVWRLAPTSFDEHGNPVFTEWTKVLTDTVFESRVKGEANALYGGNELTEVYTNDWMQADGSVAEGFYVQARGHSFDANRGGQHKITNYVPDGKGGYKMKWRVGRSNFGEARRGEITGGMRLFKPVNGILTVVDQSRSGLFLYTDDGLYVDTVFASGERKNVGPYQQPGEFFAGTVYSDAGSGKIFYAAGKYTPLLYEMEGWSVKQNPVQRLKTLPKSVSISASQIATPPEMALALRGGAGASRIARFSPALGGVVMDGSLTGWESVEPIKFSSGKEKTVEVRGLYDPDHLYLRWQVRFGDKFAAKPLPALERLFTHDQGADTFGFYLQGDVNAVPKPKGEGREGDVRFVFGVFDKSGKLEAAGVAMHPVWKAKGGRPQVYRTPVGQVPFGHVGPIEGVRMHHVLDADGKGLVLTVAIPRTAIPALKATPFGSAVRTLANFDANLGGHNKFWWANSDGSASRETYDEPSEARLYPGSWAPMQFQGLEHGSVVKHWMVLGPFGGLGAKGFRDDPQLKMKDEVRAYFEKAVFPPDEQPFDFNVVYKDESVQGWWKEAGPVRWRQVETADLDTRAIVGRSSQAWYGVSWIYAKEATPVEFVFQGHPMTPVRWFINGERVEVSEKEYAKPETGHRLLLTAIRPVSLKAGWNQVHYRAYNYGYTPFRVGLALKADEGTLWKLRFSGKPPAAE